MTISPCYLLPQIPASLAGLGELALNLRWSWSHTADALWAQVDAHLWEQTRNPWLMLQNLGEDTLQKLARSKKFKKTLDDFVQQHRALLTQPSWFQETFPHPPFSQIAYFSMEYGLSEALPIYSGGLGMLAGDYLKTASDLGLPVVGIGILWQQGYFRQSLDESGRQIEQYPYNDPTQLPVTPVRDEQGEWLRLELPFLGRTVLLRAWQVQVGRISLYLLDSNDPLNSPADRSITAELYGGGPENRLQQEICLGVGGWMLLRKLGIQVDICHLNEGHAAFVILARIYSHMQDHGSDFQCALSATRAGNVFTSHTPVAAGFDQFPTALITRYVEHAHALFGIDAENVLRMGRDHPEDPNESFNMAWLAIHGSIITNAVSALHGAVSRKLFQPLFSRWPENEVPVTHVTNGVHMPSWESEEADQIWRAHCGNTRWLGDLSTIATDFRQVSDDEIWNLRNQARQKLITFARHRLEKRLAAAQLPRDVVEQARLALDPNALILGFARRFTAYKRPNLLLSDPDRLYRLLTNARHPAQMVIAGKAHPQDNPGKQMVQEWTQFIHNHPDLEGRIIFIDDYDMLVAEHMVQGVDLWINTPRRPWEASGTSGMKVLVNGGLNVSELDGWWAEAYDPAMGWAMGDRQEHGEDVNWDRQEATRLYELLEQEIIPLFYQRRESDACPCAWVAMIRDSMAGLTPRFSSNRMLREYISTLYQPAAGILASRQNGAVVASICKWEKAIQQHWSNLHFGDLQAQQVEDQLHVQIAVYLDDLEADTVCVQMYADGQDNQPPEIYTMRRASALKGAINGYLYTLELPAKRAIADYTPRVIPCHDKVLVPMECQDILWYR